MAAWGITGTLFTCPPLGSETTAALSPGVRLSSQGASLLPRCTSPPGVRLSPRGAPLSLGCASPLGVRLSPWGAPLPSGCDSSPGVHVSSRVRLSPASRRFGVVGALHKVAFEDFLCSYFLLMEKVPLLHCPKTWNQDLITLYGSVFMCF